MEMFSFKCPAVETLNGVAYFSVEAATEAEARKLLAADSGLYFDEFSETDGGTEWDASEPSDWEIM